MEKEKKEFFLFRDKFIALILFVCSAVAGYSLWSLGILPNSYLLVALGILTTIFIIFFLLTVVTKPGKLKNSAKVMSLLLSLAMLIGSYYPISGSSFLAKITNNVDATTRYSFIVLKDSPFENLDDAKQETNGIFSKLDSKGIEQLHASYKTRLETDLITEEANGFDDLRVKLYEGEYKVIILNEAHRGFITEFDHEFENRTRVIGSFDLGVEETPKIKDRDLNVSKDTFSIFVTGIDTYGPVSTVSRSDVNMIMTVNPNEKQILLTSIPRDYHVELASFGAFDKLTHAGIYGVSESVETLEKLFNIDIDYFLKVNFSSVEKIVDAMGGVEVNSRYTFTTAGGVTFTEGPNYVNGKEALVFARERYNVPGGDNDRVLNQQALITGIINKAISPAIIMNYNAILNSVSDSMILSMDDKEFKNLIKAQLDDMGSWDIQSYAVKGYGSWSTTTYSMPGPNLYVMEPDYSTVDYAHDLITQMEKGQRIQVEQ